MNPTRSATPELAAVIATPGHTIGPFFHDALRWAESPHASGTPVGSIEIEGSIEDGSGELLPAWLVEAWVPQAVEAESGAPAPGFRRRMNDARGRFVLRVPLPPAGQPAAYVTLFGLGLTRHLHTAVFLDGALTRPSPILEAVPAERRATLIAAPVGEGRYLWKIRTQGDHETVFLEYR